MTHVLNAYIITLMREIVNNLVTSKLLKKIFKFSSTLYRGVVGNLKFSANIIIYGH